MALLIKTMQELVDDFINELQNRQPRLTDTSEGSQIDSLAGATAYLAGEATLIAQQLFEKTFFSTANGPEITGGSDDLQTLAIDHFGPAFARLPATQATGGVVFSRPTTAAGPVSILAGTVVKTAKNASGVEYRFETLEDRTLTGVSVVANVRALVAGVSGNLAPSVPLVIETPLTDTTVVAATSPSVFFVGGAEAQSDADYRAYIISQLGNRRLTVKESIEAAASDVPGITTVKAVEVYMPVIEYDIATSLPKVGTTFFRIPRAYVYIADVTGTATGGQVAQATENIDAVRAFGVAIGVIAATPLELNWTLSVVLNPLGPNYDAFSFGDFTLIQDSMSAYLHALPIGAGFDKAVALAAIEAIYGALGTGDLVSASITVPGADVGGVENQKIIPGVMTVS